MKTRLAATVPVAPPLSRRDLRSRHPGKGAGMWQTPFRKPRFTSLRRVPAVVVSGAIHQFKPLSPGA
ncbi:hypothetical protein ECZU27_49920 [Escherichia coli]|nr:hypothetical protein ECZU27_49920 [Escherichia coli]